jgi:hypothetical protein
MKRDERRSIAVSFLPLVGWRECETLQYSKGFSSLFALA